MSGTTARRPAYVGVIGLMITALLVLAAMNAGRLPVIGQGGTVLHAQFTDASGIEAGDRVEIAGVRVGEVKGLEMGRGFIDVAFTLTEEVRLGEATTARIKVANLLGSKFLQVVAAGTGRLTGVIPVERTAPAYDVTEAFGDLTETVRPIDTEQLEQALTSITGAFSGAGPDVRASVRGLSTIARTIAARDQEVGSLLRRSATLTASLDASRDDIAALIRDAAALLAELDGRRDAIHGLIVHTDDLAEQLRGLVAENEKELTPALLALGEVAGQLEERQADLEATVHAVAKFARVFVNTIGGGPWFDSYIANMPNSLEVTEP